MSHCSGGFVFDDGQMGMEDVDVTGSVTKVTDYAVGPRGIDSMSVTASGSTNVSYPLYDCHGNMVSTLAKAGSGSYSYSSVRLFDAWGNVRSANTSGDPKGRYCANLGHKQDDESGLVYMRARYYESGSGRFVSQDPACHRANWFVYANCDPVNNIDRDGKTDDQSLRMNWIMLWLSAYGFLITACDAINKSTLATTIITSGLAMILIWHADGNRTGDQGSDFESFCKLFLGTSAGALGLTAMNAIVPGTFKSIASEAVGAVEAYGAVLVMFMALTSFEDAMDQ